MKDKEGKPVVTKLNEEILKQIAVVGKGAYVRASNTEFGLNPIVDEIRKMEDETFVSLAYEDYDEEYMYFLAVALGFLIIEMCISDRRNKRQLF